MKRVGELFNLWKITLNDQLLNNALNLNGCILTPIVPFFFAMGEMPGVRKEWREEGRQEQVVLGREGERGEREKSVKIINAMVCK